MKSNDKHKIDFAAKIGSVEVIKMLHEDNATFSEKVMNIAAKHGHLDCLIIMTNILDLPDEIIGEIFIRCDKCRNWKQRTNLALVSIQLHRLYSDSILFQLGDGCMRFL